MTNHHEDLRARFADYLVTELGRRPGTARAYLSRLAYLERLTGKPIT